MAQPPAIDFDFVSPGISHPAFARADHVSAIQREIDRRQRANTAKVDRGEMRADKADLDAAIWAELLADVAGRPMRERNREFQWGGKLNALRGELIRRRRSFPNLVEQGRMTVSDRDFQIAVIESAHKSYWAEGLAFGAEFFVPGDAPRTYARLREEEARREAWQRHGGTALGDDEAEIKVETHRVRAFGRWPMQLGFARADGRDWTAFTIRDADGRETVYGADFRIRPIVDQLDPSRRILTLLDMVKALNAAWAKRSETEARKEAA